MPGDYEDNFDRYEQELKVPYFLLFYPDSQELTLYRHTGTRYQAVPPDDHGRHAIAELELEVGLPGGWVRYWYRGELLPLPADLLRALEAERQRAEDAVRRAEDAARRAEQFQQQVEQERQARQAAEGELEQLRAQRGQAPPPPGMP